MTRLFFKWATRSGQNNCFYRWKLKSNSNDSFFFLSRVFWLGLNRHSLTFTEKSMRIRFLFNKTSEFQWRFSLFMHLCKNILSMAMYDELECASMSNDLSFLFIFDIQLFIHESAFEIINFDYSVHEKII